MSVWYRSVANDGKNGRDKNNKSSKHVPSPFALVGLVIGAREEAVSEIICKDNIEL